MCSWERGDLKGGDYADLINDDIRTSAVNVNDCPNVCHATR